jgi:hypothetical protein
MNPPQTTFDFADLDSGDDACVIVTHHDDCVALTVSLKSNGDVQVCIPNDVARRIGQSLSQASL